MKDQLNYIYIMLHDFIHNRVVNKFLPLLDVLFLIYPVYSFSQKCDF